MRPAGWHVVEGDVDDGVVVVVDFAGTDLDQSLVRLRTRSDWPAFAQPSLPPVGTDAPGAHVAAWAGLLRSTGWPVRGVLAQCAGAALACALAEAVAADAAYPPVVLLDPYLVRPGAVVHEFRAALAQYEPFVGADHLDRLVQEAHDAMGDVRSTALHVDAAYRHLSASVLADLGVDDDVVDDLGARFTQYAEFLVACAEEGFSSSRDSVVTLLSDDFGRPPLLRGRVVACGGPHERLRDDARVAHALGEVVAALP